MGFCINALTVEPEMDTSNWSRKIPHDYGKPQRCVDDDTQQPKCATAEPEPAAGKGRGTRSEGQGTNLSKARYLKAVWPDFWG